jgi:hypothetical protein
MMNDNDTPNYAYLSGVLQSTLESLAYDYRFQALKTDTKRLEYIKKEIARARAMAIEYENEVINRGKFAR